MSTDILDLGPAPRVLVLSDDPTRVARQPAGERLDRLAAGPLRHDVSTDEITPVAIMSHYDAQLGRAGQHRGLRGPRLVHGREPGAPGKALRRQVAPELAPPYVEGP